MLDIDEPFTKAMLDFEPTGRFMPTVATREMLIQMEASDVYVVSWGTLARCVGHTGGCDPIVLPTAPPPPSPSVLGRQPFPSVFGSSFALADLASSNWLLHCNTHPPAAQLRSTEYFRNMLPDVPVVLCHSCNHFFHEEDWECATMSRGVCPFCRANAVDADAGTAATHPQVQGAGAAIATAMSIQ